MESVGKFSKSNSKSSTKVESELQSPVSANSSVMEHSGVSQINNSMTTSSQQLLRSLAHTEITPVPSPSGIFTTRGISSIPKKPIGTPSRKTSTELPGRFS